MVISLKLCTNCEKSQQISPTKWSNMYQKILHVQFTLLSTNLTANLTIIDQPRMSQYKSAEIIDWETDTSDDEKVVEKPKKKKEKKEKKEKTEKTEKKEKKAKKEKKVKKEKKIKEEPQVCIMLLARSK